MSGSASQNPASIESEKEFSSKRPAGEPMTTSGHQPGTLVGNDAAPEFSAQTLPAGTAPADRTFQPNPTADDVPAGANTSEDVDPDAPRTKASDTIGGATSADVHTGLGHPGQGMTSAEVRHDGEKGRKNPGKSLEGVGASVGEN